MGHFSGSAQSTSKPGFHRHPYIPSLQRFALVRRRMWSSSAHGAVLTPPRALLPTLSAFQLLHPLPYPTGRSLPEAPRPYTVRLLPVLTVSTPPHPSAGPTRHRFQQWNAQSVAQSHPPRRRPPQPDRHRCHRAFRCNGPILLLLLLLLLPAQKHSYPQQRSDTVEIQPIRAASPRPADLGDLPPSPPPPPAPPLQRAL